MQTSEKILIVGGGLSGLYLSWLLKNAGIEYLVLEGAPRLGGRIHTIYGELDTPLELGATWFSDMHPQLLTVLNDLQLEKYSQFSEGKSLFQTKSFEPPQQFYVPAAEQPSYRIKGGTGSLITAIANQLDRNCIRLNSPVTSIREQGQHLEVSIANGEVLVANRLVLCMPPQLAISNIGFNPGLPESLSSILKVVQTWMAGAIKFVLEYEQPFWRQQGFSGMLYSHAGIVMEMYDHTNFEAARFGFTGFLNSGAAAYGGDLRRSLVLQQLTELLGPAAGAPVYYEDKIWNDSYLIAGSPAFTQPHQNNGHPLLQQAWMNDKLYFCGTETAGEFGGYMEGAIVAAKRVAGDLIR